MIDKKSGNTEYAASRGKSSIIELTIIIFFGILSLIFIYPVYNILIVSVGDRADMAKQLVYIFPRKLDFSAYKLVFINNSVVSAFLISVFNTLVGTAFNMLLTLCGGYALSKKFPGKKIIMNSIIVTMFFSGGLIPFYLTVKDLHLINNILAMTIPVLINTFYLILVISYFRSIPAGLEESARIDGANDIFILFRIILPISLPTLAAITLFYAVDRWNEWYFAMLFMKDANKYPLQLLLREIIVSSNQILQNAAGASMIDSIRNVPQESLKAAIVVISVVPIAMVYPFLQKYFAKGVMIGSIKG